MATKAEQPQLQDHAATAALYATRPKSSPNSPFLDEHGKLSSAGAAASLKYANASDLPSYPSTGGVKLSSASAAASLANSNQKEFQHWKPGALPAAEKAAFLAKDYQADPLWHPELSKAGSKAALLAHKDGANVEIWLPAESSDGQSAAGQAVGRKDLSPTVNKNVPSDAHRRALLAATGAMAGSRKRAESAPIKPKDTDMPWALKAATTSHRGTPASPSKLEYTDPAIDASRIHNIAKSNISREMYGSNPPVSIEVEEKNRQDTLRASAVAMAKTMYAVQQRAIDEAKIAEGLSGTDSRRAAARSHNRRLSSASSITSDESLASSYPQYTNLQEAAMKLAQERLSKLENRHNNNNYKDYYGASVPQRSRLSIRGSLRRRASSDGQLDKVDEEQSQKIRSQMSLFRSRIDEVDTKKRTKDREALMAAAQRNVQARMSTMDEKVYNETGKVSPAMMQEWEKKARQRAEADSAARLEHHGKVEIGGGKFMDQAAIEAVARSRLQPTFDDMTEKAEAQRARDEELRLEQDEKKRKAELEKAREAEMKAAVRSAKEQEKLDERTRKEKEKQEERTKREEEKVRKAEEKRLAKEEKRKSRDNKHRSFGTILGLGGAGLAAEEGKKVVDESKEEPTEPTSPHHPAADVSSVSSSSSLEDDVVAAPPAQESVNEEKADQSEPASPTKKPWFTRFRRSSKAAKPSEEREVIGTTITAEDNSALSSPSETPAETSMREVAMAGRTTTDESEDMYGASGNRPAADRSPSISSLSSDDAPADTEDTPERGRTRRLKDKFISKIHSKAESNDDDEFEEARDKFDEENPVSGGLQDSTYMDVTKDRGHGSKFSEEL